MKIETNDQNLSKSEIILIDEFCRENDELKICSCNHKQNIIGKYDRNYFQITNSIIEMSDSCEMQLLKKVLTKTYSKIYETNDDFFDLVKNVPKEKLLVNLKSHNVHFRPVYVKHSEFGEIFSAEILINQSQDSQAIDAMVRIEMVYHFLNIF